MAENNSSRTVIHIVDDEDVNRKIIKSNLNKLHNIHFIESSNGHDALNTAQREKPDLILLDIMMPEEDGFKTCKQLKQIEQTKDIPIIFLSALDDINPKKRASMWEELTM